MPPSVILAKESNNFLTWKQEYKKIKYQQSHCLNIKGPDSKLYIISTAHGIQNKSKKIFQVLPNGKTNFIRKLHVIKRSCINDLVLMQKADNEILKNDIIKKRKLAKLDYLEDDIITIMSHNKMAKSLPKINTECISSYSNLNNSETQFINLNVKEIIFDNIDHCKYLPTIPYIECSYKENIDVLLLEGLSGNPVYTKNKIIGIIESYNIENNRIRLIPSYLILKFINDYIIGASNNIACLTLDYGLTREGVTLMNTHKKFKKNDIITKINHKNINSDGSVYSPQFKYRIPLDTYILLTFTYKDSISLGIKRQSETGKTFNHYLIRKQLQSISNILRVSNKYNENFLNINGFIFCELSLPLIKWLYHTRNIKLFGKSMEYFNYNNVCLGGTKEIVLIDYIKPTIPENIKLFENLIPLYNQKNIV